MVVLRLFRTTGRPINFRWFSDIKDASELADMSYPDLCKLARSRGIMGRMTKKQLVQLLDPAVGNIKLAGLSRRELQTVAKSMGISVGSTPTTAGVISNILQKQAPPTLLNNEKMIKTEQPSIGNAAQPALPISDLKSFRKNVKTTRFEEMINDDKNFATKPAIDALISQFTNHQNIPKALALKILTKSIEYHRQLPNIMNISRPKLSNGKQGRFTICGDTHGQYFDLLHIFDPKVGGGMPSEANPYLFNGDMVDRGMFSFEIVMTLLLMKLHKPNSIYILRGNHETNMMNESYGFAKEMEKKQDREVLQKCRELFQLLPFGAVIDNKVFVVHGGLGMKSSTMTIEQMNSKINRNVEPDQNSELSEMLWADPSPNVPGFSRSKTRLGGFCFGSDVTHKFLKNNNLDLLVRSHEVHDNGYEVFHDHKCISVFSAPNYCGVLRNKGAIIRFADPTDMKPTIIQFSSPPPKSKNVIDDYELEITKNDK